MNPLTVWQEHEFWLKILNDHAHFVHNALSVKEKRWVRKAKLFIKQFEDLCRRLYTIGPQAPVDSPEMIELAEDIYPVAEGYFEFEGHMQKLRMKNEIILDLSPTYFNGTLLENQEYLRLLSCYVKGKQPPLQTLEQLLDLWLEDQLGHAILLISILDPTEFALINLTKTKYVDRFRAYMTKNEQWKGYLRFTKPLFPARMLFVREIITTVVGFVKLVQEVVSRYKKDQVLNKTTLRFLEHHFPETCYFLQKLSCYLPEEERRSIPACQLVPPYFGHL